MEEGLLGHIVVGVAKFRPFSNSCGQDLHFWSGIWHNCFGSGDFQGSENFGGMDPMMEWGLEFMPFMHVNASAKPFNSGNLIPGLAPLLTSVFGKA